MSKTLTQTLTRALQTQARGPAPVTVTPHARRHFLRGPSRIFPCPPPSGLSSSFNSRLKTSTHLILTRKMSSAPTKKEFLCILPDKPGAQGKRVEVRPSHLEGVKPLVASGAIVAGGAMLNSHPAEGETPSFKGSMMLAVAENEAAVRKLLESDVYARSGVWDLEQAQIIPFKSAVREQL